MIQKQADVCYHQRYAPIFQLRDGLKMPIFALQSLRAVTLLQCAGEHIGRRADRRARMSQDCDFSFFSRKAQPSQCRNRSRRAATEIAGSTPAQKMAIPRHSQRTE